eukprot:NODE_5_length_49639_cov_0.484336.p14 type:complete len:295 gc:universal NODE_5_length_49639_cov_0.484336:43869-42985(-)
MQQPVHMLPTTRLSDTDPNFKAQVKKADEDIQAFKKENDILSKQTKELKELKRPQHFALLEQLGQQLESFQSQLGTLNFNVDLIQQKTNSLSCEIVAVEYLKEKSKPFPFEYFNTVLSDLQQRFKELVDLVDQFANENGDPQLIIPSIKNMFASLEWLEQNHKALHEHVQQLTSEYDRIKLQHNVMDHGGMRIQEYANALTPAKQLQQQPMPFNTQARTSFGTAPTFGQGATSGFGTTGGFGQNSTSGFGQQPSNTGFGQSNVSGFGQQPNRPSINTSFGSNLAAPKTGFSFGR